MGCHRSRAEGRRHHDHRRSTPGLATDTNGSRVAVATPREVRVTDLHTRQVERIELTGAPYSVAFAPGGEVIAVGTQTGSVELWTLKDSAKPQQIWSSQVGQSRVYDVAFDSAESGCWPQ